MNTTTSKEVRKAKRELHKLLSQIETRLNFGDADAPERYALSVQFYKELIAKAERKH